MTQNIALIVQSIMEQPDAWSESGLSIGNGYYTVKMNGSTYGMGAAGYMATGSETEILKKAIEFWVKDTGWKPPEPTAMDAAHAERNRIPISMDQYQRQAYDEFLRKVRGAHMAYGVHGNAEVFSSSVQEALRRADELLYPVSKREAKATEKKDDSL